MAMRGDAEKAHEFHTHENKLTTMLNAIARGRSSLSEIKEENDFSFFSTKGVIREIAKLITE